MDDQIASAIGERAKKSVSLGAVERVLDVLPACALASTFESSGATPPCAPPQTHAHILVHALTCAEIATKIDPVVND